MSTTHLDHKAIKRPDAFVAQTRTVFEFLHENIRGVLILVGLLFVMTLAVLGYNNLQASRAEKAGDELYSRRKALSTALEKAPKGEAALATVKEELDALETLARDYAKTHAAYQSLVTLGDVHLERGGAKAAAELYRRAGDAAASPLMKLAALRFEARAHEESRNYDGAIAALQQLLSSGDKTLRAEALLALGRNYGLKGDKSKALEQYALVAQEFPNTPLARSAETQKSLLH